MMNMNNSLKLSSTALAGLICLLLSALCFAQNGRAEQTKVESERPPEHAVEIGPGGQFRKETGYRTGVEDEKPIHAHLLWESRYVSEGRDNLDGKGLASMTSDVSVHDFTFAPWVAHGYDSDYSELNLNVVYGTQLNEHLEVYTGYAHLQIHEASDHAHDNEVGAELLFTGLAGADVQGTVYHSFEAHGAFFEMSLLRTRNINDQLTLTAGSTLGINDGYIAHGHNGLNHLQFRAQLAYHPSARIEMIAYTGYNIAIDSTPDRYPGDLSLHDFFWGGVGVIYHLR